MTPVSRSPILRFLAVLLTVSVFCTAGDRDYLIWIPRSSNADPLYRFVQKGHVGYIDQRGKIILAAALGNDGSNTGGEFHDGLLEIAAGSGVYLNTKGQRVIDIGLYRGWDFSEGLAVAMRSEGGLWGYIDTTGRFAIEPQFPGYPNGRASSFSDGLAAVEVKGKVGYIDRSGRFVISPRYIDGEAFQNGFARVIMDGPCIKNHLNQNDLGVVPRAPLSGDILPSCKYAFVDKTGAPISTGRYDDSLDVSEGVAPVRIGSVWGYVDTHGRMVIPAQFHTAASFSDGLARVSDGQMYGYINRTGAFVISPQFKYAEDFVNGIAVVGDPDLRYWYIDHRGKRAFAEEFTIASSFFKGVAHVKLFTGSWEDNVWGRGRFAYIDRAGRIIFAEDR